MIHEIKINIKEIISELATPEEIKALLWHIFTDACDTKEFDSVLKDILKDKLDCELEFDKNPELISAYNVLIKDIIKKSK